MSCLEILHIAAYFELLVQGGVGHYVLFPEGFFDFVRFLPSLGSEFLASGLNP
jgi:hypothetical protein